MPPATPDMPLLWLCGPAGVGKSTVSWQLFAELTAAGVHAAFADTDQLCMCYPAPLSDPGRELLKAQNLGAFVPNYRAAGARCMIVNGVVDPVLGVYRDLIPDAAVTVCRMRAGRDELARRFISRHRSWRRPGDDLDNALTETLAEADAMDASTFADIVIETGGGPASQVAARVRETCRDWPGFSIAAGEPAGTAGSERTQPSLPGYRAPEDAAGNIVLICGATGVGKSTIGFQLYLRCLNAGVMAGYADLGQLGFLKPEPPGDRYQHRLRAANLAAIWQNYHAAGARYLVVTGAVSSDAEVKIYRDALPAATVTLCCLRAGRAELARRVISRREGGSWPEPGDPLRGQPAEFLADVALRAAAEAGALDGLQIDTDGCTAAESAALIAAALECPAG
jgi:predicted ABC-type ATPase